MAITVVKEVVSGAETVDVLLENEVLDNETNNIEDGLIVELTDEQQTHQVELKNLVKKEKLSILAFIMNCFKVGKKLVELKKIYKEDFYNIVNSSIISKEQVRRRMKLVLRLDVDFSAAMSNKGTDSDRDESVAMLILDKRIENLSIKDLQVACDLTLEKMGDMKHLSDEDWHTVLTKSDKPYQSHKAKIDADNLKKALAEKDKHIPDGMNKEDFYDKHDKGIYGVISLLHTANTLNGSLENNVSDLEAEKKILSDKLLVAETRLEMLINNSVVKGNLASLTTDTFTKNSEKKAS